LGCLRDTHEPSELLSELLFEGVDDHLLTLGVLECVIGLLISSMLLLDPFPLQLGLAILMQIVEVPFRSTGVQWLSLCGPLLICINR
jgi:hypothetical protein